MTKLSDLPKINALAREYEDAKFFVHRLTAFRSSLRLSIDGNGPQERRDITDRFSHGCQGTIAKLLHEEALSRVSDIERKLILLGVEDLRSPATEDKALLDADSDEDQP